MTGEAAEWVAVEAALDGMLERRWYTNHGPAAQALERRLRDVFGVGHAVIATNPTVALMMLLDALGVTGAVLLSALAPRRCVQGVRWAGLEPVFCDVRASGGMGPLGVLARLRDRPSTILVSGADDAAGFATLAAEHGMAVVGDGARLEPAVMRLACCGDMAGLGCVLTRDDALAARLRNIRSSYGAGPPVPVVRTANGRVSEAQAALAMLDLDAAPSEGYAAHAGKLPGWLLPRGDETLLVLEDGKLRDVVAVSLRAGGWGAGEVVLPDVAADQCPVAASLAARALILPAGPGVDAAAVAAALRGVG